LLATATHPTVPLLVSWLFPAAVVVAGALVLAQAGLFLWDTFLGKQRDASLHAHEAPWIMLLAPAIPALLPLLVGLLPEPAWLASFLAGAAAEVYGAPVKVSLALWAGITVPLLLSAVAISLGAGLFLLRRPVRAAQMRVGGQWSLDRAYAGGLRQIDRAAALATRLQNGKLRAYLAVVLLGVFALSAGFGALSHWPGLASLARLDLDFQGNLTVLRIFALLVTVAAAAATVVLKRDFSAIVALGASGLGVAVLMALEPDPDVALVQVVVDILTMVVLVLALTRLPREERRRAWKLTFRQSRAGLARDLLIAAGSALVVAFLTLQALASRPRESILTPFFESGAKALTGAKDIVGATIVDFRALDTLVEITVFGIAGLGVFNLLRLAARKAGDAGEKRPPGGGRRLPTLGIGGPQTSPFVHALAYVSLPVSMMIATVHIMYGHDQPGDGFTAGVIISLALGFWYVVFGYHQVKQRLTWLRPNLFVGSGLLLAVLVATTAALITGSFLGHVDFGQRIGLPLPEGFHLGTSFLFEVSICLVVLGSASYMLDTLGHPGEEERG